MLIAIKHYVQYLCIRSENLYSAPRRRLVINIGGGQKFRSQILGGAKILGKFIFRQKILKSSLLFSPKFLMTTFSFSHRQLFFTKFTPFIQNVLRIFCILSLFLLSFMFICLNKQN